jgi:hypothetical protein
MAPSFTNVPAVDVDPDAWLVRAARNLVDVVTFRATHGRFTWPEVGYFDCGQPPVAVALCVANLVFNAGNDANDPPDTVIVHRSGLSDVPYRARNTETAVVGDEERVHHVSIGARGAKTRIQLKASCQRIGEVPDNHVSQIRFGLVTFDRRAHLLNEVSEYARLGVDHWHGRSLPTEVVDADLAHARAERIPSSMN